MKIDGLKSVGIVKGMGKGWYGESVEHGLASRGIKLGRKEIPTGKKKTKYEVKDVYVSIVPPGIGVTIAKK